MLSAWRIVNARHLQSAFTGIGARRYGGRWNSPGVSLVHLASQQSLAILEVLTKAGSVSPHEEYVLIPASWDEAFTERLIERALPEDWRALPPIAATKAIGDDLVKEARSAVLAVPSVIVPAEINYLINPAHPDFRRIKIGKPTPFVFDPRLPRR